MAKPKHSKQIKNAVRLVARHLKQQEKGKHLFRQSSECLSQAIALGLPLNRPFTLRDGRIVHLRDAFENANEAGGYKMFSRYRIEEYKEPKPAKAKPVEAPESEVAK